MIERLCFVDLETTGLYPGEHVILSVGAVLSHIDLSYYALITPTDEEFNRASPKALEVNGLTWDVLKKGEHLSVVRDDFAKFLLKYDIRKGKAAFVGQNPTFDMDFLRYFMGHQLVFIDAPLDNPIDVRDLYKMLVQKKLVPELERYRGAHIARALKVREEPRVHNALEGAWVVQRNYNAIMKIMKEHNIEPIHLDVE